MAPVKSVKFIWLAVCILTFIGVSIVIRRVLLIGNLISAGNGRGPDFNSGFNVPSGLTLVHVIPGLLFMISGPLQFVKGIRNKYIRFHRYSGWTFIICAYIIGVTAVIMPFISMPLGGISEAAGSVFFATFFLFAVSQALRYILLRRLDLHREWMIRTFATGLAVATVRPIMALAFIIFGLTPHEFLGTAFWIGFTTHLIAAEAWINVTKPGKKINYL